MMTDAPKSGQDNSRTATPHSFTSPVTIILVTALDTTWRIFAPVLLGVWAGISIDHWLNYAPAATICCLIIGTILSGVLVARQLRSVRSATKGNKK